MTPDHLKQEFVKQAVIPSSRNMEELVNIIGKSKHKFVMVKFGDVNTLPDIMAYIKENGREVLLHHDSLKGLARDLQGLQYLANLGVKYLITIKPQMVKTIRKLGMHPVLCLFMIDSDALRTGLKSIADTSPDTVIVMPSSVPKKAVMEIKKKARVPVVGGGMAFDQEAVQEGRRHGFHAIVASKEELWKS